MPEYEGLLAIGDPHLASRTPGYRKDDYPRVVLGKLAFALAYARQERLLPAVLGDVFHWPRDNANWLLVAALSTFEGEVVGIYGNHDCATNTLEPDDSLQVLIQAGRLRLVDAINPWRGRMGGRPVVLGGSPWGQPLPDAWERAPSDDPSTLVFWLTHHDLKIPGYEDAGRLEPRSLSHIDLVINGHIHRPLEDVRKGTTTWVTPGNIARVARGESHEARVPAVLRVDVGPDGWTKRAVEVPHAPYDDVFHPLPEGTDEDDVATVGSDFVKGLAELQAHRTGAGEGLVEFLTKNLEGVDAVVAEEIRSLAEEVCRRG